MDVKRLDEVAKKLIANVPRREAVRTLAGGISIALATRLGLGRADVEAVDCRRRRRLCNRSGSAVAIRQRAVSFQPQRAQP